MTFSTNNTLTSPANKKTATFTSLPSALELIRKAEALEQVMSGNDAPPPCCKRADCGPQGLYRSALPKRRRLGLTAFSLLVAASLVVEQSDDVIATSTSGLPSPPEEASTEDRAPWLKLKDENSRHTTDTTTSSRQAAPLTPPHSEDEKEDDEDFKDNDNKHENRTPSVHNKGPESEAVSDPNPSSEQEETVEPVSDPTPSSEQQETPELATYTSTIETIDVGQGVVFGDDAAFQFNVNLEIPLDLSLPLALFQTGGQYYCETGTLWNEFFNLSDSETPVDEGTNHSIASNLHPNGSALQPLDSAPLFPHALDLAPFLSADMSAQLTVATEGQWTLNEFAIGSGLFGVLGQQGDSIDPTIMYLGNDKSLDGLDNINLGYDNSAYTHDVDDANDADDEASLPDEDVSVTSDGGQDTDDDDAHSVATANSDSQVADVVGALDELPEEDILLPDAPVDSGIGTMSDSDDDSDGQTFSTLSSFDIPDPSETSDNDGGDQDDDDDANISDNNLDPALFSDVIAALGQDTNNNTTDDLLEYTYLDEDEAMPEYAFY
ncbi:hypothetical protein BGX29_002749 [Mortierella sp. GBA35]|nr:hypothetical protein BGX29_002749 [Mortierella sp. GBA35]